jgi:hypothetical protein
VSATNYENAHAQVCADLPSVLSSAEFDQHYEDMTVRRRFLARGLLKKDDKQAAILQTVAPLIATIAPPPVGAIGSKVISTTEAWDCARRAADFLEGLKNREADREGTFFSFYYFILLISLTDSYLFPNCSTSSATGGSAEGNF